VTAKVLARQVDDFRRDAFALQIADGFDGRILRHCQDPAGRLARGFAELKLADFAHLRAVFFDPIVARDAAIQVAMFHVAADFLRANQADFHFVVIDIREVRSAAHRDVEARLGHLLDGGVLQTALRQAEPQNLFLLHL